MAKFLVKVPAEVTANATTYCSHHLSDPCGPTCRTWWEAYAAIEGRQFALYERPRQHETEAKAIAAGKREMIRRLREWNKEEGLV